MTFVTSCLFVLLAQDPGSIAAECERFHSGNDAVKQTALHAIAKLGKPGEPQSVAVAEGLSLGLKHGGYAVRELAVKLLTSNPNVAVAKRELLLAATEAAVQQQQMTDAQQRWEDTPAPPASFEVTKTTWDDAMAAYDACVKQLRENTKAQEDFAPYQQSLLASLVTLAGGDGVPAFAANLAAMPRGRSHGAIATCLTTIGSERAAKALIAHLAAIEKSTKAGELQLKKAMRLRPGRKVPKLFSKKGWIERENRRIGLLRSLARKRIEDWKARRVEIRAALKELAKNNALKKAASGSASSWRSWLKQNAASLKS